MKKLIVLGIMAFGLSACSQPPADEQVPLNSESSKFSYLLGQDVAASLRQMGDDIDVDAFTEAFRASLKGEKSRISAEDAAKVKKTFFEKKQKEMQAKARADGESNKSSGTAFLAANKQKDGITTTPSGLQYEVLRAAKGAKPVASDTVKVHYRGTLIDGTEFDSSYARGEPATFPLGGVIPGWTEGLQKMNVGSKYRLFVPSDLGYGERGAGSKIGPNAALIFEVELLEIVKK
ncbi:FKBP-type peptidyl-prolyl cis-trans isomerase [Pseudomonadota bacterium]